MEDRSARSNFHNQTTHTNNDNANFKLTEIVTSVGPIKDFKFNSCGTRLAVIGKNCNFAQIWDVKTKQLIRSLLGHQEDITCLAWYPFLSNIVITGSKHGVIKLWNATSGKCIKTHTGPKKHSAFIKAPITSLAFSDSPYCMLLAGNEAGLSFIQLYTEDYQRFSVIDDLEFKDPTGSVYHTSFHQDTTFACTAHANGLVRIFARSAFFKINNSTNAWKCCMERNLRETERLESVIFHDQKHIFLRIKNITTEEQSCIVIKLDNGYEQELEIRVSDYCALTKKFLMTENERQIFEYDFNPTSEEGPSERTHVFKGSSNVISALYNPRGDQIIVKTDKDLTLLEKNANQWLCIFSMPAQSHVIFHPKNKNIFASILLPQNSAENTSIILGESSRLEPNNLENNLNESNSEESVSLKRNRSTLNSDQNKPGQNKRTKFQDKDYSSTEEYEDYPSTEEYSFTEDEEDDFLLMDQEEEILKLDDDEVDQQDHIRRHKEIQTILAMGQLLEACPDVPDVLKKSLTEIVANYSEDIIKKYLAQCNGNFNEQDDQGRTALFTAADTNKEFIVNLLIKLGADVNIPNQQGFSPLHQAIDKNYLPIAQCLLAYKALVNTHTSGGTTPLHSAVLHKNLALVRLLLDADADMGAVDNNSNTPMSLVIASRDHDLIKLFVEKLKKN